MIPRKIHYCWFSDEPYPPLVKECLDSWHKYMPEYEFVLWDYQRIKDIDSIWLQECLKVKKWAFAADFIRLWAVYHEGGIYLDSDVLLYQSLEPFLSDKMFIGREGVRYITFDNNIEVFLTSHCFGAEAGHPFLLLNLDYYSGRHFISCDRQSVPNSLRYDMLMMPYIQSTLAKDYGYDAGLLSDSIQHLSCDVTVYPACYFGVCDSVHGDNSYARHLGQGSWREPEYWSFKQKLKQSVQSTPITFKYKIRWRLVLLVKMIAYKLGYILLKIDRNGLL